MLCEDNVSQAKLNNRLCQTQRAKRNRKAIASQEQRQVAKLRLSQADQHTPHFEGSTLSVAMRVTIKI